MPHRQPFKRPCAGLGRSKLQLCALATTVAVALGLPHGSDFGGDNERLQDGSTLAGPPTVQGADESICTRALEEYKSETDVRLAEMSEQIKQVAAKHEQEARTLRG
eukprot:SAG31_NODE_12425_length_943_cov_0.983412_1_plen_105_part_10